MHAAFASVIGDAWDSLDERRFLLLTLIGFVCAFGFIRLSTRLMRSPRVPWWPGSVVSDSGVHLHHLVWGICLMLAAGTLGFALFQKSPGLEICAALFGVGAGFTVDEFALWVYLDDVYWAKEGRASIDAAVIAATLMLLALLGAQPFEVRGGGAAQIAVELSVAALVIGLAIASLTPLVFAVTVPVAWFRPFAISWAMLAVLAALFVGTNCGFGTRIKQGRLDRSEFDATLAAGQSGLLADHGTVNVAIWDDWEGGDIVTTGGDEELCSAGMFDPDFLPENWF